MKALLALLALALTTTLVWQWRDWPPPAPGPSAAGAKSPPAEARPQPAENPLESLPPIGGKDDFLIVTERPLFLRDRRPPNKESVEDEAAAEAEPPSDLTRMDLNAVLITPSKSSAWIWDPAKKELVRLRPGDELAGWAVQEILSDRVVLERQGEKDTLVLRDYKNMPPPRRKLAARKPQRHRAAGKRQVPQAQPPDRSRTEGSRRDAPQLGLGRAPRTQMNARQPFQ